jgi:transcriptional regulator with XRE-family HTH domain
MKSAMNDVLPTRVRRALVKFGADISVARRRRGITTKMMAERLGVARTTYDRVEHGDPRVAIGTYMMALFVLGLGTPIDALVDPRTDETGTLLAAEHLPKRVRPKREPQPK